MVGSDLLTLIQEDKEDFSQDRTASPSLTAPETQTPARRSSRQTSLSPSDAPARRTRSHKPAAGDFMTSASASLANKASARHARPTSLQSVSDKLRRSLSQQAQASSSNNSNSTSLRRDPVERGRAAGAGLLATPDNTDARTATELTSRPRSRRPDLVQDSRESTPSAPPQGHVQFEAASPADSDSHTIFSSNVATPPITDADPDPTVDIDDMLPRPARLHSRPTIDTVAAQDASLPSPRLSPTLAASQLHDAEEEVDEGQSSFNTSATEPSGWMDHSQTPDGTECNELVPVGYRHENDSSQHPVVVDTQTMLEAFDSMRTEMKTFMMYQFLRRCPRNTLRVVAAAVNPALKCDFFKQLPLEISYQVLSYLSVVDLCRAAQVSKQWRNIVDRNETGWKELLDRDGLTLPPGELNKAITQGWGWQDPVGADGYEKDLSMHNRLTSSEIDLVRAAKTEATTKLRSSKRKRGMNAYSASERSKRRAYSHDMSAVEEDRPILETKQHKSEGPISATNAAATAVPDPKLGLASLRQLHLYKSLYRRHHMIRESWTNGKVRPSHVAFSAHPRHVITCLQFDENKIITGSDDTLIHIYDTKTGELLKKLEGHEGGVWALQYEGNILVSGSTDRSVRVWDIERGLCQQVFYGHTSTVRCLQILMPTETGRNADGTAIMQPEKPLIITGSRDSQLRVWRLPEVGSRRYIQTGPPAQESDCPYFIRVLAGHTHSVRAIAAHGDTLVSGSYDSTVRVWRISTGELVRVLQGHTQKVYSVVLDHERNRCISGSMDSHVKIWDLNTGLCTHTLEGHSMLVGLLDLRDDRLVSAAADSTLRIWDPVTGKCKNTLMAHTGAITCFQHDGQKVISGSEKTVKMWDVRNGECVQDLLTDLRGVWQVKFDERRCVAAVQRGDLTYVEILDFGAARDGHPREKLGQRVLLNEEEVSALMEEEA